MRIAREEGRDALEGQVHMWEFMPSLSGREHHGSMRRGTSTQIDEGALPSKEDILRAAYDELDRDNQNERNERLDRKSTLIGILILTVLFVLCALYFLIRK